MAFKVNHIHFKGPDPRKTAQWYVDFMGAKIISERETTGGHPYFRIAFNGVEANVTGILPEQNLARQHYGVEHFAIDTDTYEADVAKVKASGAKVLEERGGNGVRRVCFFEGPDGVQVELLEVKSIS